MKFFLSFVVAPLIALAAALPAIAADVDAPMILVAKRQLQDKLYGASILVARPIGSDQHIGFILNRPTRVTLSDLFPAHAPSKRVVDPVFLGGPISSESIFALVQTTKNPGGRSVKLFDNVFAVIDGKLVDDVIEKDPGHARFVAGLVAWRSGELTEEIRRGAWHVLAADSGLVLRKPDGLWEELVRRAELRANGI